MRYYAGIGSRETPDSIIDLMDEIGMYFGRSGLTLRSDGAKQIFYAKNTNKGYYLGGPNVNTQLAYKLAQRTWERRNIPVYWMRLNTYTQALHARNGFQILGPDMETPTDLIICWTKTGGESGGTGQALAMARFINENPKYPHVIPIINLQKESHRELIKNALKDPETFISYSKGILQKQYNKERV